jgi:hypothetical protein
MPGLQKNHFAKPAITSMMSAVEAGINNYLAKKILNLKIKSYKLTQIIFAPNLRHITLVLTVYSFAS